jgi:PKD repeat protein
MALAIKYKWDWGDGTISYGVNPTHKYSYPGTYNVYKTTYYIDGTDSGPILDSTEVVPESSTNANSQHNVDLFLDDNKKCIRLTDNGEEVGWSYISGANWLWPESRADICHFTKDGVRYALIWDNDGDAYIYNLRASTDDNVNIVYKDKAAANGTGGSSIACSTRFMERAGENSHYKIKHEESFLKVRPEGDSYVSGTSIDMSLIKDNGASSVETQFNLDTDTEILFSNKDVSDTFQLQMDVSESGWKLLRKEMYLSITDKARYPSSIDNNYSSKAELYFNNPYRWYTRGGYTTDRGYNGYDLSTMDSGLTVTGPDGREGSAYDPDGTDIIINFVGGTYPIFSYWTHPDAPDPVSSVSLGAYRTTDDGEWELRLIHVFPPTSITIITGAYPMFDFRYFTNHAEGNQEYALGEVMYNDVINNNGRTFLPRF